VSTREEILKTIEEHKAEIRAFGVSRIGLFGSFARNEAREDSDLDILVDLEKKTFDAYMGLMIYLEDLFGRKIDLVMRESVKPRLRDTILNEAVYATGF